MANKTNITITATFTTEFNMLKAIVIIFRFALISISGGQAAQSPVMFGIPRPSRDLQFESPLLTSCTAFLWSRGSSSRRKVGVWLGLFIKKGKKNPACVLNGTAASVGTLLP